MGWGRSILWALLGTATGVRPSPKAQVRGRATTQAGIGFAARHGATATTRARVEPGLWRRLERELVFGLRLRQDLRWRFELSVTLMPRLRQGTLGQIRYPLNPVQPKITF